LSVVRILVADDWENWRKQVRLLLQGRPEWQVVVEAVDGSEAIQKAEELKPDLIVLDIGLPKLNGIEAARRIRQLCPGSKIIFLSLHGSSEVVQAALSTGGLGYVRKIDARRELVLAVDAVLRGKQFVSSSVKVFTDTSEEKTPHRHQVLFYSSEMVFLEGVTRFIATALRAGNAAIVLATKAHQDSLLERLKADGIDTDAALQHGTCILLDAADTLSTIMVNDLPDPARFFGSIGGLIKSAAKAAQSQQPNVVVFGEAEALLQAEGKPDAAIRIEQLVNNLADAYEVDILCAYPLSSFQRQEDEHVFQSIRAEHSAIYYQ
jgi:DNA-binding NarL/FixJ family response regulator